MLLLNGHGFVGSDIDEVKHILELEQQGLD